MHSINSRGSQCQQRPRLTGKSLVLECILSVFQCVPMCSRQSAAWRHAHTWRCAHWLCALEVRLENMAITLISCLVFTIVEKRWQRCAYVFTKVIFFRRCGTQIAAGAQSRRRPHRCQLLAVIKSVETRRPKGRRIRETDML